MDQTERTFHESAADHAKWDFDIKNHFKKKSSKVTKIITLVVLHIL